MLLMASFRDSRIADFARRHAAYRLLATLFEQSCHRSSGLHQLPRCFCASQVQGVEYAVTCLVKRLGSVGNLVILLNDLGCECQQRHVPRFPFQIRISIDLLGQGMA